MEQCISGFLVGASLLLALWHRAPANLERYLWAVLIEIPFLWAANAWWGDWSVAYAVTYIVFTVPILYCIARFVLDCLRGRPMRLRALAISSLFAMVTARGAYLGLPQPVDGFRAISIVEGFVLVWAGLLSLFLTPYVRRPDLIFPLGLLWLGQAYFSFGWTFNALSWGHALNWLVPPALGCACFLLIAWRLRVTMAAT